MELPNLNLMLPQRQSYDCYLNELLVLTEIVFNIFFMHMNYSVIKRIALLLNFNHVISLGSNLLTRKVIDL